MIQDRPLDRDLLLFEIPDWIRDALPQFDTPLEQIQSDVWHLALWDLLPGDIDPIRAFLRSCISMTQQTPKAALYRELRDAFGENTDDDRIDFVRSIPTPRHVASDHLIREWVALLDR